MKTVLLRIVLIAFVLALASAAAAAGDADINVKWPARQGSPTIARETDSSGKAWVVIDAARARIVLINVPDAWDVTVTPSPISQPSIRVTHDAPASRQVYVKAYIGNEELTDAALVVKGQVVELPTANRLSIEIQDLK